MKLPPWNFAPYSQKEKIEARLEHEREALGICFAFGTSTETTLVGGELVTVARVQWRQLPTPTADRPECGAKTRSGRPCRRKVAIKANGDWCKKCSKHGGLSTGAKTPAGRARQSAAVAQANRNRKGTYYRVAMPEDEIKTGEDLATLTPAQRRQWIEAQTRRARREETSAAPKAPAPNAALIAALQKLSPEQRAEISNRAARELERRALAADA